MESKIKQNILIVSLIIYILSGILAYGHYMNRLSNKDIEQKDIITSISVTVFSPLYWSMILQENKNGRN